MKLLISMSVDYEDIGATKPVRGRKRIGNKPKRVVGYRRKSRPPKGMREKLAREVRNLRSQVKKRLDIVTLRKGTPQEITEARTESRKLYRDYIRAKARLDKMPKQK